MMATLGFEKLGVYRLAERLADAIWEVVSRWNGLARDTVGKQVVRSADGIGANIAEGTGRGSFKDNRRFVRMARASLYETHHWLRRAYKRRLLTASQSAALKPLLDELRPRLNAYLGSIGRADPDSKGPRTKHQGPTTKDQGQRTKDKGQSTRD
jgi:four helix bundle protein